MALSLLTSLICSCQRVFAAEPITEFTSIHVIHVASSLNWVSKLNSHLSELGGVLHCTFHNCQSTCTILPIQLTISLLSIATSSHNNKVLSVEPTPHALDYLRRNITKNGCSQSIIVFEGVATNEKGVLRLNTIPGSEEYSSLSDIVHTAVHGRPCVCRTSPWHS